MEIKINAVNKKYGSYQAIKEINLTIPQGMFGLLGPNGAGKTTLMQMLATLEPATSGSIIFSGMSPSAASIDSRISSGTATSLDDSLPSTGTATSSGGSVSSRAATPLDDRASSRLAASSASGITAARNRSSRDLVMGRDDQEIRKLLGYLPQEFGVYKKLTGYEYLDYVAMMKGIVNSRQRKQEINELLEKVNMTQHAKKRIGRYSGGMKQRIGIAQALLGSPRVIIVDEPTAGLDPEERIRFRNLLGELSADRIIILSTHIVADIESSCNQLAIMKQGRILFLGTQSDLLDLVRDRVWIGIVDESLYAELRKRTKIITARKVFEGHEIRVLSDELPFRGAELVRPGLEDAYMSVMEADEQKEAFA